MTRIVNRTMFAALLALFFTLLVVGGEASAASCGVPKSIKVQTSDADGKYTVSWGASATAKGAYVLEEATNSAFTAGKKTVYSGTAKKVTLSGRSKNKTYYYRVKTTKKGYKVSGWRTGANGCAVPGTKAGVPKSIVVPATDDDGSYPVAWGTSATEKVFYVLEEANTSNFTTGKRIAYTGTAKSKVITGRVMGKTYYYRVKATKAGLQDSAWRTGENGSVNEEHLSGFILINQGLEFTLATNVPGDFPTISSAIAGVESGSTIQVDAGNYNEGHAITINKSVTLIGAGMNTTVISGGIVIGADSVTVKGFTITEGDTGILVNSPNATIMYNKITGNAIPEEPSTGCGISVKAIKCTIKNNLIVNNSAKLGGNGIGILLDSVSGVLIENNTIKGNNGLNGAFVGDGVGIRAISSTATIKNNIIVEHDGVDEWHGTGNPSMITGYGIFAVGSTLTIDYNNVWKNPVAPGSIGNGGDGWDNWGSRTIPGANYSGCSAGAHDISADPLFSDGLYHLADGSPSKDSGDPASEYSDETDDGRIDIGAYGNINDSLIPQ